MNTPKPDANETAARIVNESTATADAATQADIEAAWLEWSKHVQKVDGRGMALLRAAFEAGFDFASSHPKNLIGENSCS